MLNIVIFGAPGAGKGTQSDNLISTYHLLHISTGDVLRDKIRRPILRLRRGFQERASHPAQPGAQGDAFCDIHP